jgi:hypothetical protein
VVQSQRRQWRIVICDSDEHVALWVATVACLLPPAYRPLVTFATYHHDPRQAPFMIIGADAARSAALEDDASIFLLDAVRGRCSSVEPSPYAELAVAAAQPDLYENILLTLFATMFELDEVDASPVRIDERLDQLALYVRERMRDDPDWFQGHLQE